MIDHPLLPQLDQLFRSAVSTTCNLVINEDQWTQASLPVWSGGLGIRNVTMLAPSAFLASAAGTSSLQTQILHKCRIAEEDMTGPISCWQRLASSGDDVQLPVGTQRQLDSIVVTRAYRTHLDGG